jgi:hypothetical protein
VARPRFGIGGVTGFVGTKMPSQSISTQPLDAASSLSCTADVEARLVAIVSASRCTALLSDYPHWTVKPVARPDKVPMRRSRKCAGAGSKPEPSARDTCARERSSQKDSQCVLRSSSAGKHSPTFRLARRFPV